MQKNIVIRRRKKEDRCDWPKREKKGRNTNPEDIANLSGAFYDRMDGFL
jgi:hypothetical protein